jgi:hypothetical protein
LRIAASLKAPHQKPIALTDEVVLNFGRSRGVDAVNGDVDTADLKLVAGMPVETFIEHHKRTLFEWIVEPIQRSFVERGREY